MNPALAVAVEDVLETIKAADRLVVTVHYLVRVGEIGAFAGPCRQKEGEEQQGYLNGPGFCWKAAHCFKPLSNHHLNPSISGFGNVVGGGNERVAFAMIDDGHIFPIDVFSTEEIVDQLCPFE